MSKIVGGIFCQIQQIAHFCSPIPHQIHHPTTPTHSLIPTFSNSQIHTMSKHKLTTKRESRNFQKLDKEDNSKFMMVLAISTVLLMVLMYWIFVK